MANLKTINFTNSEIGSVDLDLNNSDKESLKSIAYVVKWQLAKRRSGAASTKTMAEISGTTAKPHNQKGTGRARQGSKRSVQFRGGRACFGPRPRSFDFSMPKKIVKAALRDTLKLKIKENKIIFFSEFKEGLKTAQVNKVLKNNNIKSALFLFESNEKNSLNFTKSVRNIKDIKALDFKAINVYDILNFDFLMLDKKLFENIKGVVA